MFIIIKENVISNAGIVHPERDEKASDQPAAMPSHTKSTRFAFLDGLRGIAALWVVIYHLCIGGHVDLLLNRLPGWIVTFLKAGHLGVPIFFVLSGFVITYSVSRFRVDLPFIGRFAMRRSLRLDPPYWASLALVVVMGLISNVVLNNGYHPPDLTTVLVNLFYLQNILGFKEINGVSWTLTFEIQFYLIFCLLAGLVDATRRNAEDKRSFFLVFVPALVVGALWPLGIVRFPEVPAFFPCLWHGFLLGMLACWAMNGTVRPFWFFVYAAIIGGGAAWNGFGWAVACVVTSVIIYLVAWKGDLTTWLNWRWLQFLGLISYSLYLTHEPMLGPLFNVAYRITSRSLASESFWFFAVNVALIAFAAMTWWLVERPSLALAHHLSLRRKS